MSCCTRSPYKLPELHFVGGETQDLVFNVYFFLGKRPFPLDGCTARFSVVDYINPLGQPIIQENAEAIFNEDHTTLNVLTVTLEPEQTVNLRGKYIYQIQLKDPDGEVEIPWQGHMYIHNNIDKSFIS